MFSLILKDIFFVHLNFKTTDFKFIERCQISFISDIINGNIGFILSLKLELKKLELYKIDVYCYLDKEHLVNELIIRFTDAHLNKYD